MQRKLNAVHQFFLMQSTKLIDKLAMAEITSHSNCTGNVDRNWADNGLQP